MSVIRPDLYMFITAPLSTVIVKYSVLHHPYADDCQLKKSAPHRQIPELFLSMQKCTEDVKFWMTLNKLRLNDDKTEAVIVSSGRKSRSLSFSFPDSVTVGSASVALSDSVKNFGVTLDCHMTMKTPCLQKQTNSLPKSRCRQGIWYAQLTLNSVALVPSFIFSPQIPQRLLSLPVFFHV